MPQFSLLIPVYDGKKTLPRLLESLFNCRPGVSFEAIFAVEPGFTEDIAILEDAASKDERIRFIVNQERLGPMRSRERCLSIATGDYIAFADCDDYLSPDFFLLMHEGFRLGADCVQCSFCVDRQGSVKPDPFSYKKRKLLSGEEAAYALLLDKAVRGFIWNKAFKRENLLTHPAIVLPGRFEDMAFVFPFFLNADKVAFIPERLYFYSKSGEGETDRNPRSRPFEHLASLASIRHYVDMYRPSFRKLFEKSRLRSFLSLAYDWHLARKAGAEAEELEEVWACFKKIYGPGLMPLEGRGYSPYLSPAIPYRSLAERIEKGRESI